MAGSDPPHRHSVSSTSPQATLHDDSGPHEHNTSPPTADGEQHEHHHPQGLEALTFPQLTTDRDQTGLTDEYATTAPTGFVPLTEELDAAKRAELEAHAPEPPKDALGKGVSQPQADPNTELRKLPSKFGTPRKDLEKEAGRETRLKDVELVTWLPEDKENPRNWSKAFRWYITGVAAAAVVAVAFASAVVTGDFQDIQKEFGMGLEVVTLSVSLMVCGFGIGPLFWSPLSELYGRRPLWIVPFALYIIFNIPCALAPNIQTLLICRFISGVFASAPLTLAGGSIADVWDFDERGFAIAIFAAAPYSGPVLGPLVGGWVGQTIGWRWMLWVNMIFAGAIWLLVLPIPETFAPVILKRRAARMRTETGRDNIATEQELFQASFSRMLQETLIRPFQMLVTEPILLLMSLYIALIYAQLYGFFFSYPIVFGEGYQFSNGIVGLTFCSIFIGVAGALIVTPLLERLYLKSARDKGGKADPEDRLPGMMLGAPFVPIALFIFGWTSNPVVKPEGGNWVGPASSGIPFGFGMVCIYFSANAYLIDTFPDYVASALAAKTVVRSGLGAAMPLFIVQMYHGLGNAWAASLLAFVSLAMVPIPFAFYRWGASIRSRSKRATS